MSGREDHISYFGLPLTGGTNMPVYGGSIWTIAPATGTTRCSSTTAPPNR